MHMHLHVRDSSRQQKPNELGATQRDNSPCAPICETGAEGRLPPPQGPCSAGPEDLLQSLDEA